MKCKTCNDTGSKDKIGSYLDCDECDIANYLYKEGGIFRSMVINGQINSFRAVDAWLEAKRQSKLEIDELKDRIKQLEDVVKYQDNLLY